MSLPAISSRLIVETDTPALRAHSSSVRRSAMHAVDGRVHPGIPEIQSIV